LGYGHQHHALGESGFPADHAALQKAADWLIGKEVRVGAIDDEQSASGASGWAFEYNNVYYPDTDYTAMVDGLRLCNRKIGNHSTNFFRALAWH